MFLLALRMMEYVTLTSDCDSGWIRASLNIAGQLVDGSAHETTVTICSAHVINIQITVSNNYVFIS